MSIKTKMKRTIYTVQIVLLQHKIVGSVAPKIQPVLQQTSNFWLALRLHGKAKSAPELQFLGRTWYYSSWFIRCCMLTQTGSQTSGVYSTVQYVRVECQPFYPWWQEGQPPLLIPFFFFFLLFYSPPLDCSLCSCCSSSDLHKNADRIVSSIWHVSGTDVKGHSWYWQSWSVSIKCWTPINVPCGCIEHIIDWGNSLQMITLRLPLGITSLKFAKPWQTLPNPVSTVIPTKQI